MFWPLNIRFELEFYLKLSGVIIQTVSNVSDKIIIASWIKNLSSDNNKNYYVKLEYLKVLLFLISKKCLLGPFSMRIPPKRILGPLPNDYRLKNIQKNFLEKKYLKSMKISECTLQNSPCVVAFSSDFKKYTATQEIPNFGIHTYFSVSPHPVTNWNNSENLQVPPNIFHSDKKIIYSTNSVVNCTCLVCTCDGSKKLVGFESSKSTQNENNYTRNITKVTSNREYQKNYIDRIPPIWGSNLLTTLSEPSKQKNLPLKKITREEKLSSQTKILFEKPSIKSLSDKKIVPSLELITKKKSNIKLITPMSRHIEDVKYPICIRSEENPFYKSNYTSMRQPGGVDPLNKQSINSNYQNYSLFLTQEQFSLSSDESLDNEQEFTELKYKIREIQQQIIKKLHNEKYSEELPRKYQRRRHRKNKSSR